MLQLSVTVGGTNETIFEQLTVRSDGQPTIVGGVLSTSTITLNEQVLVLFDPSVALNITSVVPEGKIVPDTNPIICSTVATPQSSFAIGESNVIIPGQETEISDGQLKSSGGVTSFTVIIKEQDAVLPDPSAAMNVFVVIPFAKYEPDANPEVCVILGKTLLHEITIKPFPLLTPTVFIGFVPPL